MSGREFTSTNSLDTSTDLFFERPVLLVGSRFRYSSVVWTTGTPRRPFCHIDLVSVISPLIVRYFSVTITQKLPLTTTCRLVYQDIPKHSWSFKKDLFYLWVTSLNLVFRAIRTKYKSDLVRLTTLKSDNPFPVVSMVDPPVILLVYPLSHQPDLIMSYTTTGPLPILSFFPQVSTELILNSRDFLLPLVSSTSVQKHSSLPYPYSSTHL